MVSRQWGFTKFSREDYLAWKAQGRICPDGVNAKLWENHGPIAERKPETLFLTPARVYKGAMRRKSQPRRGFTLSDVMLLLINTE